MPLTADVLSNADQWVEVALGRGLTDLQREKKDATHGSFQMLTAEPLVLGEVVVEELALTGTESGDAKIPAQEVKSASHEMTSKGMATPGDR